MSKDLLVIVDMQNDFVTGALGTAEAQAMLPALSALAHGWQGPVIFTRDTHTPDYLNTQEGRNLPVPHCIRDTPGWQIVEELRDLIRAHAEVTGSPKAKRILADFEAWLPKFKKILPHDYDRMLRTIARYEAQGMDQAQAEAEAFYVNARGKGD